MAVVKADAYGHGMAAVVPQLLSLGVRSFAAATLDEGSQLRALGAEGTVLILGCTSPQRAGELARLGLTQTVADLAHAEALNAQGVPAARTFEDRHRDAPPRHRVGRAGGGERGVSHGKSHGGRDIFASLLRRQSRAGRCFVHTRADPSVLCADGGACRAGHFPAEAASQSSYGLLNYPELRCGYARVGLALYGAAEGTAARSLGLRPVLSLRARVASVRDVAKGESVGYDRAFTARRKSRIAVLPIGYADGYPRALSNTGLVRIHGCLAPVAGRICMDQLAWT